MFSAYRLDQYSDPDGFTAQAAVVLAQYDYEVVFYVTDPRTGIQRTQKWPPTISEIVDACERKVTAIAREIELEKWRERKRITDEMKDKGAPVPRSPGTFNYKEFIERFGKNARPVGRFEKIEKDGTIRW